MNVPGRPPQAGDRVRAVENRREGRVLEGTLWVSDINRWGTVAVKVLADGRLTGVVVGSIEVLEPSPQVVSAIPGVRVANLREADEQGYLPPPVERTNDTWADLDAHLLERAQPLLDAGWQVTGTDRDESWEYGDSVFLQLTRSGGTIELEYYDHGQLVAYPVTSPHEEPDEEAEPFFSIVDATHERARLEFAAQGWLSPPPS